MFWPIVYAAAGDGAEVKLSPPTGFTNLGSITVSKLVSGGIELVLILAALVFFFVLVIGGIRWILSGGDENKVKGAKGQITNALIGLAIIFVAWAIGTMMHTIFGVAIFGNFTLPKVY